ncbi:ribosomal protein L21-like protein [Pelagophyceae sp. CCMP2097]|nr:ribosomal protein L21-like protein [Pelagophyceae sp. CCMP2097]
MTPKLKAKNAVAAAKFAKAATIPSTLHSVLTQHEGVGHIPVPDASDALSFAVIKLGNTQYKVTRNDLIVAEKIRGADIDSKMVLKEVLLCATIHETIVGRPLVEDCQVLLTVEEVTKDKKVIVFKKRRRKNSRRRNGYRRTVTLLRVSDIICPRLGIGGEMPSAATPLAVAGASYEDEEIEGDDDDDDDDDDFHPLDQDGDDDDDDDDDDDFEEPDEDIIDVPSTPKKAK